MNDIDVFTIGFTKKSANIFFNLISGEPIKTLIDVRLNTTSQLSGFAKSKDLKYFLNEICNVNYEHHEEMAPTKEILDAYKKHKGSWEVYEYEFFNLMEKRNIEKTFDSTTLSNSCLLCSEDKPHFCHRRLVVEYLNKHWDLNINVKHLY